MSVNFVYAFSGDEALLEGRDARYRGSVDDDLLIIRDGDGREELRTIIVSLTTTALTLRDPSSGHTAVFIHPN